MREPPINTGFGDSDSEVSLEHLFKLIEQIFTLDVCLNIMPSESVTTFESEGHLIKKVKQRLELPSHIQAQLLQNVHEKMSAYAEA